MRKIILPIVIVLLSFGCKKQPTFQQQCEDSIKSSLTVNSEENIFWNDGRSVIFNKDTKDATDIQFQNFTQIDIPLSEIDSLYWWNTQWYPNPNAHKTDEVLRKRYTPTNYSVEVSFDIEKKLIEGGKKTKYLFLCYLNDKAQIMGCLIKKQY